MSRLSALLFPQSPLAILLLDSESMKINEANPAAGRLFGKEPLSFQDQTLKSICAFGEYARLQSILERSSGPHTISVKLLKAKGEVFIAEIRTALLDGGGENEWLLFIRDISLELEARDALRRSEREYRRMVENSPDGIALIQDGIVVFANMACEKLIGVSSPDELWASEFESFVHPDDLELWQVRQKRILEGENLGRTEMRLLKVNGSVADVELAQYSIERPEGKAIQITLRDITARKKMEQQLKESEERYKGLAGVAFDGVAIHFDGILLQSNHAFDAIFGYENDTKGRSLYELIADEQREYLRRELDSGNVLELEALRSDGQRVFIEASTRACTFLGEPAYVTAIRDISARKNAEKAIRHQAYFDGLTGLPNRLLFFDRLGVAVAQAAREGSQLAVMFLDLDRFKSVNDSLGHNVGDLLLFETAGRLVSCLRRGDTVSRLGGDEFTILLNDLKEPGDALIVAEKIIRAINEPFLIQDEPINIGVSIGVSLFPEHGDDPNLLISNADAAMYYAKDNGRNHFHVFTQETASKKSNVLNLESRLRHAIENQEFVLYYQPKHSLSSGRLVGAEALLRWIHPERGIIMPDEFIELAEDSRLILPLGDWVLRECCRQSKAWARDHFKISLNLSPWQLHEPSLIASVDDALRQSGADPFALEIEITETVAMQNPGQTLSVLRELTSRNLSISLDDFGKGYSALNYLKQFPVDTIKIDMSFIRDVLTEPKDAAIIRAIILLGHNLDMKVLAEGIETKEQHEFLKAEGCDLAQGYYYARPMPVAEFEKLFEKVEAK